MFEVSAVVGEWCLTALEFDVLWQVSGRDRLPYPVQYRGDAETTDEERLARGAAADTLRGRIDEGMHAALAVLLDPEVRVEVCGFRGADATAMTRIHVGIRGGTGVVIRQGAGTDLDGGGDVHLAAMPADRVAAAVADALPREAKGAGRRVAGRREEGVMRPVSAGGDDLEYFLTRPRAGVGEIGIHPGPAFDWRPDDEGTVLHWVDVVGDGRYLVIGDEAAEPVSAGELAARLREVIGAVVDGQVNTTSHTAT